MAFNDEMKSSGIKPLSILKVNFPNGERSFSTEEVRGARRYEGRILSASALRRTLPESFGLLQQVDFEVVLSNNDLDLSKHLAPYETKNPKNAGMSLSFGTATTAEGSFQKVFKGRVQDFSMGEFSLRLRARDVITDLPEFPNTGYITTDKYPNAFPGHVGRPIPFVYGDHNSKNLSLVNPAQGGPWRTSYIDNTASAFKFVVAGHRVKSVSKVYKNGQELLSGFSVMESTLGAGTMLTLIQFTDTASFVDSNGQLAEISVDVKGRTFSGTPSGTLIDNPSDIVKDMLPAFFGNPAIDTAAFSKARRVAAIRGFTGAGGYSEKMRTDEFLKAISDSFDMRMFGNVDGEIGINIFSPVRDAENTSEAFDDALDFIGPAQLEFQTDEIINSIRIFYSFHESLREYSAVDVIEDADSITRYGRKYEAEIMAPWLREAGSAQAIGKRILAKQKNPFVRVSGRTTLKGLTVDLAEMVVMTQREGPDMNGAGFNRRLFEVRALDADLSSHEIGVLFADIDFLSRRAIYLGDETILPHEYAAATTAQRQFGYLCDESTGKFSNGDDGKRLVL